METSTLIRKVHMDCPLCDKTHEVEERKRFATITLKGDKVTYEERFYFCANANDWIGYNKLDRFFKVI